MTIRSGKVLIVPSKKTVCCLLVALLMLSLVGCGKGGNQEPSSS